MSRAFPQDGLEALADVVHACGGATGVVGTLAGALRPLRWVESRAAVSGLRRQGPAAVGAIPALSAWTMLHAGAAEEPGEQLTVHEAALALRDLRAALWGASGPVPRPERVRLIRFQLEVVDPHLLALMALPPRLWHRGVIGCLRDARPGAARCAVALEHWLGAPAVPPPGYEGWWEYARAEALTALAELAPLPDPYDAPEPADLDALERLWDAPASTEGPEADPPGTGTADA